MSSHAEANGKHFLTQFRSIRQLNISLRCFIFNYELVLSFYKCTRFKGSKIRVGILVFLDFQYLIIMPFALWKKIPNNLYTYSLIIMKVSLNIELYATQYVGRYSNKGNLRQFNRNIRKYDNKEPIFFTLKCSVRFACKKNIDFHLFSVVYSYMYFLTAQRALSIKIIVRKLQLNRNPSSYPHSITRYISTTIR